MNLRRRQRGFLLNPFRFGAAPVGTTYRYWRISATANDGDATFISLSELQFYESADGTGTNRSIGGTAAQNSDSAVGPASRAIDNNDNSECGGNIVNPYNLSVDLGATYTILSMGMISQRSVTGRTPTSFLIQGSTDNAAWTTVKTITGSTGWGIKERRVYAL